MHEVSLCEEILKIAFEEVNKLKVPVKRILNIRLVIGELHQVINENMEFIYETLTRDTIAQGSKLDIIRKPIVIQCKKCGWEGQIENFNFSCLQCQSGDIDMKNGKEFYLENIEIED